MKKQKESIIAMGREWRCIPKNNVVDMFNIYNDTEMWAACIDGMFGLLNTREEVESLCDLIDQDVLVIPPDGHIGVKSEWEHLSKKNPIDIKAYIQEKARLRFIAKKITWGPSQSQ